MTTRDRNHALTRRARRPVAAAVLLLALGACDRGSTDSLPEAMLGRWYYDGSSGGIDGGGNSDEATGYIVIAPDNTIETYREDGSFVSRTAFMAAREKTIYATEDLWVIYYPLRGEPEVVVLSDDGQTLSLSPNAYDAIGRSYVRSR